MIHTSGFIQHFLVWMWLIIVTLHIIMVCLLVGDAATFYKKPHNQWQFENLLVYCHLNLKIPPLTFLLSVVSQVSTCDHDLSSPSTNTNSFWSHWCRGSTAQTITNSNGTVHFPVPFSPSKGARCGIKPRHFSWCHEEGKPNSGGWACHSCSCCHKAYCWPSAQIIIGIAFTYM